MADQIRYDLLTQQALRGVVRNVLAETAQKGALPGEHHFYIAFDTTAEGVRMSERLRAQYPEQMTIILQHQFWDLKVTDDGLRGRPVVRRRAGASSTVPFEAIKGSSIRRCSSACNSRRSAKRPGAAGAAPTTPKSSRTSRRQGRRRKPPSPRSARR